MSADQSSYRISVADLRALVAAVFRAAGSANGEARIVPDHLVDANLAGHESHGVIRVSKYVDWHAKGMVIANRHAVVVRESPCNAVIDGQFGYGQVIGREAMDLAIAKARQSGLCAVAIRNAGHLGRIGDWPLMAAEAGKLSLHFVNTTGAGILVAPHGGINRRLSANPIAAGVPVPGRAPILLDVSACTLADIPRSSSVSSFRPACSISRKILTSGSSTSSRRPVRPLRRISSRCHAARA